MSFPKRGRPKGMRLPIDLSSLPSSERLTQVDPNAPSQSNGELSIPKALKLDVQLQDLELVQELGAGNGGTVHKVLHKTTRSVMALKVQIEC